ncbi:MAG: hypothetical protein U0Y08_04005 [Bacteroidia bacterium]
MKKVIYLIAGVAVTLVAACGPSAEEKAAEEKRVQDSIAGVAAAEAAARVQDSIMKVEAATKDSLALIEKQQADSIAAKATADSIAAAKKKAVKPAPKKTPEQKKIEKEIKEVKDATRGRG